MRLLSTDIINGVSIVAVDNVKVSSDDLFALSCAVFIHVYVSKYAYCLATKELMEQIKKIRGATSKNLISAFWDTLKTLVGSTYKLITHTIYDVIFFWITFPELFPIRIEEAVKFHRMSEYAAALDDDCRCDQYKINLSDTKEIETDLVESLEITKENVDRVADKILKLEEVFSKKTVAVSPEKKSVVEVVERPKSHRLEQSSRYQGSLAGVLIAVPFTRCAEPKKSLVKLPSPGDGNCMFYSFLQAEGSSIDRDQDDRMMMVNFLKNQLLETARGIEKYPSIITEKEFKEQLEVVLVEDNQEGNDLTLYLYSIVRETGVCIHDEGENQNLRVNPLNSSKWIHLSFYIRHYDTLIPKLTEDTDEPKNVQERKDKTFVTARSTKSSMTMSGANYSLSKPFKRCSQPRSKLTKFPAKT